MRVIHHEEIENQPVDMAGSENCQVRLLIQPSDGAPNFAMRQFEVAPGGFTPQHHHPYEHEVYVLEGEGTVLEGEQLHRLTPGMTVFVPADEVHQFRNTGETPLKFLCLVPNEATSPSTPVVPECGVEPK